VQEAAGQLECIEDAEGSDKGERRQEKHSKGTATNIQKMKTSMNRTSSPRIPPPAAPPCDMPPPWMLTSPARTRGARQAWMRRAVKAVVLDAMMWKDVDMVRLVLVVKAANT